MSAAVPCNGEFIAIRSPNALCMKFEDASSGTGKVLVAKGILSAEASGGDVALGTLAGAIAGMTSVVTAMPTATVSTGITITKDNVSALTSATLSVTKG